MPKILIVEDEKTLAEMYSDYFEKKGYEVVCAGNVSLSLEAVKEESPDIILLDILLPGRSGIEFLSELRDLEDQEGSEIPIIAFSNYDDSETREKAFKFGVKDYIIKTNSTPSKILEIVENYI